MSDEQPDRLPWTHPDAPSVLMVLEEILARTVAPLGERPNLEIPGEMLIPLHVATVSLVALMERGDPVQPGEYMAAKYIVSHLQAITTKYVADHATPAGFVEWRNYMMSIQEDRAADDVLGDYEQYFNEEEGP